MSDEVIIVCGEFEIDSADIFAAKSAMREMMAQTAKEKGCIHYRFYQDIEHANWLHVYEEWETEADLAAHAASAHMQVFRGEMEKLGVETRYVRKIRGEPGTLL